MGSLLAPTLVLILIAIHETGHAIAGLTSGIPAAVRVLRRKRTRQPADRTRPLSPEQDARVTAPSAWMFAAAPLVELSGRQGQPSADGSPQPLSKTQPYHPNRLSRCARRSDDTDARREARRCFGRSDRSALRESEGNRLCSAYPVEQG
jgi:hypothetical protein